MFLDREIRVYDGEYVKLLDVFKCLERLTKEGKVETNDRRKIYKIFKLNGLGNAFLKMQLPSDRTHKCGRKYNNMTCLKYCDLINMENVIKTCFEKGIISTRYREELCFINELTQYFSYNKDIKISTQVKCGNYKIDATIGSMFAVEFDESEHQYKTNKDMKRMKEIALFMHFQNDGYFYDYNDVSQIPEPITIKGDGFTYYDFNSIQFLRITDLKDFSWVPIMYKAYETNIDILYQDFACYYNDSIENTYKYKLVA